MRIIALFLFAIFANPAYAENCEFFVFEPYKNCAHPSHGPLYFAKSGPNCPKIYNQCRKPSGKFDSIELSKDDNYLNARPLSCGIGSLRSSGSFTSISK